MGKVPSAGIRPPRFIRLLPASVATGLILAVIPATAGPAGAARTAPRSAHQAAQISLADAPSGLRAAVLHSAAFRHGQSSAPDAEPGPPHDQLGYSVAVSGKDALVGAPGVNNSAGAAYIFTRHRSSWRLQTVLTDPSDLPGDSFGDHVALAGSTALVGGFNAVTYVYTLSRGHWRHSATFADRPLALTSSLMFLRPAAGTVLGYARSGSHWHLQSTLTAPTGVNDFGCSAAVSGPTLVVGACGGMYSVGAKALVYQRSSTGWVLQITLADPAFSGRDSFASSVAAAGTTIMVSSEGADSFSGATYVYRLTGSGWALQSTLTPATGSGAAGFGSAISLSGRTAVIGAGSQNGNSGAAYIYALTGGTWRQQAVVLDPDRPKQDFFGDAAAVAGKTVVVGSEFTGSVTGAAYTYDLSRGRWARQAELVDPYARPGAERGAAVAISGSTAVVGAWGVKAQRGAAYVYVKSHGHWHQKATLSDPFAQSGDLFGYAVAVSGSTIMVGAPGEDTALGALVIYVKSGAGWSRQAEITDPSPSPSSLDSFGRAIAFSGSTAVLGGSGSAYVYQRSSTTWSEEATLADPGNAVFDGFGGAVGYAGSTIVVGASGTNNDVGAAYVYAGSGSTWTLQGTLNDPDARPNDSFGTSVAVAGSSILVGAPGVGDLAGAAYVYGLSGSLWLFEKTLTIARRVNISGGFGGVVALIGTGRHVIALISGVSESGLTNARKRCGNAFEFGRPSGHWREIVKVADPSCHSYDEFGYALSMSGTTALLGAPGTHTDNGAVYLVGLVKP
jgi:FG-GAP repeat